MTTAPVHLEAAATLLAGLEALATAAHSDVYDEVHRVLQEALADTDAR